MYECSLPAKHLFKIPRISITKIATNWHEINFNFSYKLVKEKIQLGIAYVNVLFIIRQVAYVALNKT